MTRADQDKAEQAYTRVSVEAYLRAVAEERERIQVAIAEARARSAWARNESDRLMATDTAGPDRLTEELRLPPPPDESRWAQPEVPTVAAHD